MRNLARVAMLIFLAPSAFAQDAGITSRPTAPVERAGTNFDAALQCMDRLLAFSRYRSGMRILVHRLDEPQQEVGANTRDLIVRSLSRMNEQSRFFQIETDPSEDTLAQLPPTAVVVEGSVTAFERDLKAKNKQGGVNLGPIGFGLSGSNSESRMEVSLYFKGGGKQPAILQGSQSSVTMTLRNRNKGGDASGNIGLLGGLFFGVNFSSNDGPMATLGALIDVALIQSVGRYANVPYESCLSSNATDPNGTAAAAKRFARMKPVEQVGAIAKGLISRGLFPPPAPTQLTAALRAAISGFQQQQGLIPSGEPSLELYLALYRDRFGKVSATPLPKLDEAASLNPLGLLLGPATPAMKAVPGGLLIGLNDRVVISLSSIEPAYFACFYQDGDRNIRMLMPNDQRGDLPLQPGEKVTMPGPGDLYRIRAVTPNSVELIQCFGASAPVEPAIPAAYRQRYGSAQRAMLLAEYMTVRKALQESGLPRISFAQLAWTTQCPDLTTAFGLSACRTGN